MKKVLLLIFAILMIMTLAACSKEEAKVDNLKVALAMEAPKTDGGFGQAAYEGVLKAEKDLGAEITVSESLKPSDFERTINDYAKSGNDVIIGHGFQFSDAIKKVAAEYPDIIFILNSTVYTDNKNVGSIMIKYDQAGFLQGAFAALMSKSQNMGAIGSVEIPPIKAELVGFETGAKYINPNAKITLAYTGSRDDVNAAKELAITLISQGADILMTDANHASKGVYLAAEEKGIWSINSINEEYKEYPKNLIACAIADFADAMYQTIEKIDNGTYKVDTEYFGLEQGTVKWTYNDALKSKVPKAVLDKMAEIEKQLKSGELDLTKLIPKK